MQQNKIQISPSTEPLPLPLAAATKTYADACWQRNPRISPDSWRLLDGLTVGKVALLVTDATSGQLAEAYAQGINLWAVLPSQIEAVSQFLQDNPTAQPVLVGLWPWLAESTAPDFSALPLTALLPVLPEEPLSDDQLTQLLTQLEAQVRAGDIQCYGIAGEALALPPEDADFLGFARVLHCARTASQTVWQRRKRPALKLLGVPCNMLELSALHTPTVTQTTGTMVSVVDAAVQQGMAVLALRPLTVRTAQGGVNLAQALEQSGQIPHVSEHLPPPWQEVPFPTMGLNAVASWPGIIAALLDQPLVTHTPAAFTHGDFPDPAWYLPTKDCG